MTEKTTSEWVEVSDGEKESYSKCPADCCPTGNESASLMSEEVGGSNLGRGVVAGYLHDLGNDTEWNGVSKRQSKSSPRDARLWHAQSRRSRCHG